MNDSSAEWLAGLVHGAAAAGKAPGPTAVPAGRVITAPSGAQYGLGDSVAKTAGYNLYRCFLSNGTEGVLKIAATLEQNAALDREAYLLRHLMARSLEVDAGLEENKKYRHHYGFPEVVESFVSESQGNRRVNILKFAEMVTGIGDLTPLSSIIRKERQRIDRRTSGWILGKNLRTLSFAHRHGVANNGVSIGTVLINKPEHLTVLFAWDAATQPQDGKERTAAFARDISQLALAVIDALEGDLKTGKLPPEGTENDIRYQDFLVELASGRVADALEAHTRYYQLNREIYPVRGFHPYTAYPRTKTGVK